MKIDYLGHSEMLINIENENGENVKILSDTWLSDYSVADLMQRNPMINIDWKKLETIDAVFISHAHMDHFDPYTLTKIYSKLKNKPKLLLPETLLYTKELLESELNCDIQILKNKETIQVNGINIQGVIFPDYMNTNEADVMTLCVWNEKEIVFTEVDIVPPDSEDGIAYIYELFSQKNFQTRLYVATRNELEGNLTIIDLKPEQRKEFYQEYLERRIAEMYEHYNNIFVLEEEGIKSNIYTLPGFTKAFIGQGIIFPADKLGCDALKLQILPLEEEVKYEKQVIEDFGIIFPMYEMNRITGFEQDLQDEKRNLDRKSSYDWLGRYIFENGELEKVEKIPYLEGKYFKTKQDLDCPCQRELNDKEIADDLFRGLSDDKKLDFIEKNIKRILDYLNTRFLPYQMGRLDANLKNLALGNDGKYIIQLKTKDGILGYFIWELGSVGFRFIRGIGTDLRTELGQMESGNKDYKDELTYKVIGCAYKVYNELGKGLQEKVYKQVFKKLLQDKGFYVLDEVKQDIILDGKKVGYTKIDLLVNNELPIELKAKGFLTKEDFRQARKYIKFGNYKRGLLIDFSQDSLVIKRINLDNNEYKKISPNSNQKSVLIHKYNETYFIEDLINFMDGKIELYSNFWQYLEPGTNIYLWECLGANFINNDIVLKKFKYHFELAKQGKSSEDFLKKLNIFK